MAGGMRRSGSGGSGGLVSHQPARIEPLEHPTKRTACCNKFAITRWTHQQSDGGYNVRSVQIAMSFVQGCGASLSTRVIIALDTGRPRQAATKRGLGWTARAGRRCVTGDAHATTECEICKEGGTDVAEEVCAMLQQERDRGEGGWVGGGKPAHIHADLIAARRSF